MKLVPTTYSKIVYLMLEGKEHQPQFPRTHSFYLIGAGHTQYPALQPPWIPKEPA